MFSQADLARSRGTAGAFHVRRGASRGANKPWEPVFPRDPM